MGGMSALPGSADILPRGRSWSGSVWSRSLSLTAPPFLRECHPTEPSTHLWCAACIEGYPVIASRHRSTGPQGWPGSWEHDPRDDRQISASTGNAYGGPWPWRPERHHARQAYSSRTVGQDLRVRQRPRHVTFHDGHDLRCLEHAAGQFRQRLSRLPYFPLHEPVSIPWEPGWPCASPAPKAWTINL